MGGRDDEEDEDPYKTTDPKKREPSPCESTITDVLKLVTQPWLGFMIVSFADKSHPLI